jgi:hypothetical protein
MLISETDIVACDPLSETCTSAEAFNKNKLLDNILEIY